MAGNADMFDEPLVFRFEQPLKGAARTYNLLIIRFVPNPVILVNIDRVHPKFPKAGFNIPRYTIGGTIQRFCSQNRFFLDLLYRQPDSMFAGGIRSGGIDTNWPLKTSR